MKASAKAKRYIWIVKWGEFQHYPPDRDRPPAWIKDYTAQLADERYLQLTDRQRALLRDLRDIFAITRGRLSDDTRMIARRRSCHTRDADLKALVHAGLIDVISRPTLDRRLEKFYASRARARSRGEVEVKNPPTPRRRGKPKAGQNGTGPAANAHAILHNIAHGHTWDDATSEDSITDEMRRAVQAATHTDPDPWDIEEALTTWRTTKAARYPEVTT